MNKIKKYEMPMLISIFLLVFIALISVSYAYFKARINNIESASTIAFTSGEMTINYENNSAVLTGTNIIPGWSTTKKFTLKGKNDSKPTGTQPDNNMYYKIGIAVDINTFTQDAITYLLEKDSTSSTNGQMQDTTSGIVQQIGTKYIGKGYFTETSTFVSHIYKLTISFLNKDENQYYDNDKKFAAHVVIEKSSSSETIGTLSFSNAIDYISKLYDTDASSNYLEQDDTDDKNLRYIGASPKNYITFNNETWRIIGVFNNVTTIDDNGNEKTESLVKLIRDEPLGDYSWDTTKTKLSGVKEFGNNEWSQADIMTELNNDYIDTSKISGKTNWYNYNNQSRTETYDYSKNIKSAFINKIATVRWNLGGVSSTIKLASDFYNNERGTEHVKNPEDKIKRTNNWDGKIALIYPSDYGYASTDTTCRETSIRLIYCKNNNWLSKNLSYLTLTPETGAYNTVFYVNGGGQVDVNYVNNSNDVFPTIFLKSNIKITGGTGDVSDPFILD